MHRINLLAVGLLGACQLAAPSGSSLSSRAVTPCVEAALVHWLNDAATTEDALRDAEVHSRAARSLVAWRAGADGVDGTDDDHVYTSLADADAVPQVGPSAITALVLHGETLCTESPDDAAATCADTALFDFVNKSSTGPDLLITAGATSRAATHIVAHRDGPDGLAGTGDDQLFATEADLDAVRWVGPSTIAKLHAYASGLCSQVDVVFSPQPWADSHIARAIEQIDAATTSVDVAMYSFSDASAQAALGRAVARGLSVRAILHGASDDRKDPAGTRSASLEDLGIEVRWINKIMHHKFVILDGPRTDLAAAADATLLTGSGNWSYSAATKYDENTVEITGDAKLALSYQREFDHLWANGRELVWNETIAPVTTVAITDAEIEAADGSQAWFTSANFHTYVSSRYGATFSRVRGNRTVSNQLVALIDGAEKSIDIASGHMRSRPIAEALMRKAADRPDVAIRVYLDGQEYTGSWKAVEDEDDYVACLADAGDDARDIEDCEDAGAYFGYPLFAAGIDLRFKYYAYRWNYSYAEQLHHKLIIVDGEKVATGSYNFSPNAEYDTMENVALYDASRYPDLVASFREHFDTIWQTGQGDDRLTDLYAEIDGTGNVPLVFDSMALSWTEVHDLKAAIVAACPDANSDEYRQDPTSHWYCVR